MTRVGVALLVAGMLAAPAAAAGPSGLRGVVRRGPIRPVCQVGVPCSAPAQHVTLVFLRNGAAAGRVTTDGQGRYRILLAPGAYAVRIAGVRFGFRPQQVSVPAGRIAVRPFSIDTGIR